MGRNFHITNIDKTIGKRIKLRRIMLGMRQRDLAGLCGLTFQQIQKYENAKNKLPISRLFLISRELKVPIEFFFDDTNNMYKTESLELLNLYWKLPKDIRKKLILKWMKVFCDSQK
jgi:transcriptional regulator with XRE-family HTH domain